MNLTDDAKRKIKILEKLEKSHPSKEHDIKNKITILNGGININNVDFLSRALDDINSFIKELIWKR